MQHMKWNWEQQTSYRELPKDLEESCFAGQILNACEMK